MLIAQEGVAVPTSRGNWSQQVTVNADHWDELVDRYNLLERALAEVRNDHLPRLSAVEQHEMPSVAGLRGVHLQCGLGLETVGLTHLGARMTGLDASSEAIEAATQIAQLADAEIQYEVADVTGNLSEYENAFDFVYTSRGVLRWLPGLDSWASNIHSMLRPHGWFYIFEVHPLVYRIAAATNNSVSLTGDYFAEQTLWKNLEHTHLGPISQQENALVGHVDWRLDTIINSLLEAELAIEFYREHHDCCYSRRGILSQATNGSWRLPGDPSCPLSFSMLASRRD